MKKIILLISISILLTGCSEKAPKLDKPKLTPQDCAEGLIFTNLNYAGFGDGRCLSEDAILTIRTNHCIKEVKRLKLKDDSIKKQILDNCVKNQ